MPAVPKTSIFDLLEIEPVDIIIIDNETQGLDISSIIKKIKTRLENTQLILLSDGSDAEEDIAKYLSGFILKTYTDNLIVSAINTSLKTKENIDKLSIRNKDLADSLYRLNVLFITPVLNFQEHLIQKELFKLYD